MTQTDTKSRATKYLTFRLSGEEYGMEILKVREIIRMTEITRVPGTPEFIKGLINLRGRVIPVITLRTRLGMPPIEPTERTCIVIAQISHEGKIITMGLIIDEICEVADLLTAEIEPPPEFGSTVHVDYLLGIGKSGERVIILLNAEKVLSRDELRVLQESVPA